MWRVEPAAEYAIELVETRRDGGLKKGMLMRSHDVADYPVNRR